MDEQKIASANYILGFYNEVTQLNNNYAIFLNLMIEIEKTTGQDLSGLTEIHKEALLKVIQTVRFNIHKTFIYYKALKPSMRGLNNISTKWINSVTAYLSEKLPKEKTIEIKKIAMQMIQEKKQMPDIENIYDKLKGQLIIDKETSQQYVEAINSIIVNEVMRDLLRSGQDIINEIYAT